MELSIPEKHHGGNCRREKRGIIDEKRKIIRRRFTHTQKVGSRKCRDWTVKAVQSSLPRYTPRDLTANPRWGDPSRCGFPILPFIIFIIPETVLAGNSKRESTTVKVDTVRDDDKEKVYFFFTFSCLRIFRVALQKWENRKFPNTVFLPV